MPVTFTIPPISFPLQTVDWKFDGVSPTVTTTTPSVSHTFSGLGSHWVEILINGEYNTAAGVYIGYGFISVHGPADPVPESIGSIPITFSRTEASLAADVTYSTSNDTAIAGINYAQTTGTVTFGASELQKTISVPIIDNTSYEGNVAFYVGGNSTTAGYFVDNRSTPPGYEINAAARVVIVENDPPSMFSFDQPSYTANETDGHITVLIRRANDLTHTASTEVSVGPYSPATTDVLLWRGVTLNFDANETAKTIEIPIIHDELYEGDANIGLSLEPRPPSITGAVAATNLLIRENDVPSISVNDVTIREGDPNEKATAAFTITTNSVASRVDAAIQLTSETAIQGRDFGVPTLTSVSLGGYFDYQRTAMLNVPITGNTVVEKNRTFRVELSSPNAAVLRSGTGTIVDDDIDVSPTELTLLTGTVQQVELRTGEPSNVDRTVNISSPGAVVPPAMTLPAGATSVTIPVTGGEWGDFPVTITTPPELFSRTWRLTTHVFTNALARLLPVLLAMRPEESTVLTVDVIPAQAGPTKVVITSSDPESVSVQSPIEVPAGGSTPVAITAKDPGRAILTALAGGTTADTAEIDVIDGDLPAITAIEPDRAPPSGAALLIHGINFLPGCSVRIAGNEATANYVDEQTLSAVAPAHEPGMVDVQVICGAKSATLPRSLEYFVVRRRGARH